MRNLSTSNGISKSGKATTGFMLVVAGVTALRDAPPFAICGRKPILHWSRNKSETKRTATATRRRPADV